jgi:hypothetical protein
MLTLMTCAGVTARIGGQSSASALEIQNALGVRVLPVDDASLPVLQVWIPGERNPSAVIEFPEHAWAKIRLEDEPTWFYHLYRRDPQFRGQGTWTRKSNALRYALGLPSGATIAGTATLGLDGLILQYEINWTGHVFAEVQAPTCIKLYRPFTDIFLERTYVHHSDGLELLASETPERLGRNAEEWLPCRYVARCEPPAVSAQQRLERQPDGIVRYTKTKLTDLSLIATESSPAGWIAATHALKAPTVWTNPARTCHHADSSTVLRTDTPARLGLKLYIVRSTLSDLWATVQKNRATRML